MTVKVRPSEMPFGVPKKKPGVANMPSLDAPKTPQNEGSIACRVSSAGVKPGQRARRIGVAKHTMSPAASQRRQRHQPNTIAPRASTTGARAGRTPRNPGAARMNRRAVPLHPSIVKRAMPNGRPAGLPRRRHGVATTNTGAAQAQQATIALLE